MDRTSAIKVYWLVLPFLLSTLAFGSTVVPKLNLIKLLLCRQYYDDRAAADPTFQFAPIVFDDSNPQCDHNEEVQAAVAMFTLYANLIGGVLAAVTCPKLGALSDRYGRLRILAITSVGQFTGELLIIVAASRPDVFSVYWFLVAYAVDGLCGSFTAGMAITNAYASDCTPPSRRAVAFGYIHGCIFAGVAFGPLLAARIVEATGQLVSMFYFAIGAHAIFILVILTIVPESLTKARQLTARERRKQQQQQQQLADRERSGPGGAAPSGPFAFMWRFVGGRGLLAPLQVFWPSGPGASASLRRNLVLLAAVDTTMFGVAMGSMTVVIIYTSYAFGWGNTKTNEFVSIVSVARVSVLLLALPLVVRLVRGRSGAAKQTKRGSDWVDLALIRTAIVFDMLGYIGYGLARTGDAMIASGVIAAVGGIGSPTLQSSLTKHVPPDRVGQLLGAMGLLHALARVVAPTIFNFVYAQTVVRHLPQAVFVLLAASFALALILSLFLRTHVYYDAPADQGARRSEGNRAGAEAEADEERQLLM